MNVSILSASILFATAGTALAETDALTETVPAPSNALELTLGAGFSQGRGGLGGNMPAFQDVAGPGVGLAASLGWRVTPNFLVGGYVDLMGFGDSDNSNHGAVTVATGIKLDWHFLPTASRDPWVSLGTGVKFMGIEDGDNDRALTGLELAKLQVGLDFRISPRFAIGPVIGASAAMFNHQYTDAMGDEAMALDDKKINWTLSVGVLGRYDAFGTTR